jgi:uncharacterized protein
MRVGGCAGRWCWLLAALAAACASAPAPPGRRHLPDDVGELVWIALKAHDLDPVLSRFDPNMAWSLPREKLSDYWSSVSGPLGRLRSWRITDQSFQDGRTRLVYDLVFDSGRAEGVVAVNQGDLTVAGLFVTPVRVPPPEPSPLARDEPSITPAVPGVRAEAVRLGAAPWQLDGVLTRPARRGTFPAALLVGGSGPLDKDATVGRNRPFRDLAEGLSQKGLVVLRHDKRTFAHPDRLDMRTVTVDQEVIADALLALELLRGRPEVRPDLVFLVGHGLGAQLAPVIAERDGRTAGLVLLAPPARPATVAAIEQLRFLKRAPPEELALLEKQAAAIGAGTARPDETFLGAPSSYFIDLQRRDGMAAARALGKPLLLLRGSRDYQVLAGELERWRQALAGQPRVRADVLPGLNHLFMAGKGRPNPEEYLLPGKVSPAVASRVAAFVRSVAAQTARRPRPTPKARAKVAAPARAR